MNAALPVGAPASFELHVDAADLPDETLAITRREDFAAEARPGHAGEDRAFGGFERERQRAAAVRRAAAGVGAVVDVALHAVLRAAAEPDVQRLLQAGRFH